MACCFSRGGSLPGASVAPVHVILWFDTEDYLLPADDDACKQLAELLSAKHIRATFKVVGEKARVLEQRGRRDVISALKKHDIGFHANFHSVHPTPTEYLADCGLLDGTDEFVRREGGGAADVRRILGVRTLVCYGQPGSSWAPQALAGLNRIGVAPHGVPCYVDEGDHVGLNGQPFWYMNTLNVYHMQDNWTRMELHAPDALEPACAKINNIASRLRNQGGGLISIFYHPCEWVHQEFWDGVNFRRGANPPREQWQPPPQRSAAETAAAFQRFSKYIDYIRSLPEVRFITAGELPLLYPDPVRSKGTSAAEIAEIASHIQKNSDLDFFVLNGKTYSAADQFELLAKAVDRLMRGEKLASSIPSSGLLGPDAAPPSSSRTQLEWFEFRDSLPQVIAFLEQEHRVPARVFIGAEAVPPADYLGALAFDYCACARDHRLPQGNPVPMQKRDLLAKRFVAEDSPGLFGGWIIHREGFRAPKLMELAQLQAWTLKPAIPEKPRSPGPGR